MDTVLYIVCNSAERKNGDRFQNSLASQSSHQLSERVCLSKVLKLSHTREHTCAHNKHKHTYHIKERENNKKCIFSFHFLSMSVHNTTQHTHVEAREQTTKVGFLLLPCRFQGTNSGHLAWQHVHFPASHLTAHTLFKGKYYIK